MRMANRHLFSSEFESGRAHLSMIMEILPKKSDVSIVVWERHLSLLSILRVKTGKTLSKTVHF